MTGLPFDRLLTPKEVARALGVSTYSFRLWCREGKGPRATLLSKRPLYASSDVREWLQQRKAG